MPERTGDRVRWFLSRCELLDGEPDDVLSRLRMGSQLVRVDRRAKLRAPGGDSGLFVVGTGRVRSFRRDGDRELTLDYLGAGDLAGEAVLVGSTAAPELVATESVEAVSV